MLCVRYTNLDNRWDWRLPPHPQHLAAESITYSLKTPGWSSPLAKGSNDWNLSWGLPGLHCAHSDKWHYLANVELHTSLLAHGKKPTLRIHVLKPPSNRNVKPLSLPSPSPSVFAQEKPKVTASSLLVVSSRPKQVALQPEQLRVQPKSKTVKEIRQSWPASSPEQLRLVYL